MSIKLHPDRLFSPDPAVRRHARRLYEEAATLPIISPHGHVDPALFSDPDAVFGNPARLFIIPDQTRSAPMDVMFRIVYQLLA